MSYTQKLLTFIDDSPTSFHVVDNLKQQLTLENYQELNEQTAWSLQQGKKYFVTRADGSIIIFTTPKNWTKDYSFNIIGAHTDSPCLRLKNNPVSSKEGYQLLNVEIYGGVLLTSWFDRDLNFGGRLIIENENGDLEQRIVKKPTQKAQFLAGIYFYTMLRNQVLVVLTTNLFMRQD